jgi:hypothetical protein
MNIFMVDSDPEVAARCLVDRHVVKMILESAQLLSTAHRIIDGESKIKTVDGKSKSHWELADSRETLLYKATHINHPSAIWCRESVPNYLWLAEHFYALMNEYTHRYNKKHKCYGLLSCALLSPPKGVEKQEFTRIKEAMDDKYIISEDPIENYRNYYNTAKRHLFAWKNRKPPDWIIL